VSILTDLPGRTAAYRVAEVRRPMSCVVLKRLVTEGGDVKAGSSYTKSIRCRFRPICESTRR
jgi:membrane fusion protein (multidrug efflux system)